MASSSRRRLYTGVKQTKRMVTLPEEVDRAYQRIAAEEGVTVNSLLNDASLLWLESRRAQRPLNFNSAAGIQQNYHLTATSPVHTSLDNYGTRLASVRNAFAETRDALAGDPKEQ